MCCFVELLLGFAAQIGSIYHSALVGSIFAILHRWKCKYSDINLVEAKSLLELNKEIGGQKKMPAESMLKIRVLEEINSRKVVCPAKKKQAVEYLIGRCLRQMRRSYRYLGLRSKYRYCPR